MFCEAYGGEDMQKSSVSEGHRRFREGGENVCKMMKKMVVKDLKEPIYVCFRILLSNASYTAELCH
jgi:hypothetical protein